ncbi:unnamed protein product [Protopolystoma xenopodis]|uniref:Uncharacterized protein n=1 Tax=Protopolystoma xenopodis TaxID=117903 RepID=A0A3S5BAX6_9PLAT|nr:unnamed protein product [Protopolystoma xenopodis]
MRGYSAGSHQPTSVASSSRAATSPTGHDHASLDNAPSREFRSSPRPVVVTNMAAPAPVTAARARAALEQRRAGGGSEAGPHVAAVGPVGSSLSQSLAEFVEAERLCETTARSPVAVGFREIGVWREGQAPQVSSPTPGGHDVYMRLGRRRPIYETAGQQKEAPEKEEEEEKERERPPSERVLSAIDEVRLGG